MIHWVKPTMAMVESIAADMRQADVDEVWASDHSPPLDALLSSWNASVVATVAVDDDEVPLVMFGLVERDLLSGSGVVWMLGANSATKYRKEFLRRTKSIVYEMLNICPRLCNMVHDKNESSIRWLRWLGFTIESPEPHGPDGELFHRFYLERIR
jgi:hypothetical protein